MLHSNQFLAHSARAAKPTCGACHCVCPSLKGHHHNTCPQQSNTLPKGAGIHLLQGAGPCTTTEYLVEREVREGTHHWPAETSHNEVLIRLWGEEMLLLLGLILGHTK